MRRSLLVLLVVAVLVVGFVLTRTSRPPVESGSAPGQQPGAAVPPPPTSAPTSVAAAPAAPPTAPPRPTAVPTPAPTPTPASRDMVMEVTEAELQSQLTTMLVGKSLGTTPLGDATVQTVSVALRDRQVQVSGAASVGFLNAPFTAAGTVAPDAGGRPKVTVEEATVGGVILPDGTRAALADLLQTEVDRTFADQSMKVRTIEIANGKMRLIGTSGS
jgi:hypothetical protein